MPVIYKVKNILYIKSKTVEVIEPLVDDDYL